MSIIIKFYIREVALDSFHTLSLFLLTYRFDASASLYFLAKYFFFTIIFLSAVLQCGLHLFLSSSPSLPGLRGLLTDGVPF